MNGDLDRDGPSNIPPISGSKRKAEENGSASNSRAKRTRYITIACNECKRRKIKCNGNQPCQRCGNLSLECVYAPNCCSNNLQNSEEFQHIRSHIASLQQQVDVLFANLNSLRQHRTSSNASLDLTYPGSENGAILADREQQSIPSSGRKEKNFPQFHGPTSSVYGFEVANSTLQTMGITHESTIDEVPIPSDRTATASPMGTIRPQPSEDLLWSMSREEGVQLCRVYEEEIGMMYPLFDIEVITGHVHVLWNYLESTLRVKPGHDPGTHAIDDDDTNLVKMILATALVLEGNGQSDHGQRMFESLRPAVTAKVWGPSSVKGLSLICVAAIYYFERGDEGQAWRLIGIAARSCIEMGLHRRESLLKSFNNESEYLSAVKVFWVVYALDRRWSFGMGMPFALQDADIDPSLPEPDDSNQYFKQITKYNHIASKVWYYNLSHETGSDLKHDGLGFLDYQILQWYEHVPENLKFNRHDIAGEARIVDRGHRRLRLLLLLRLNQARISTYRPVLNSSTSIFSHVGEARIVVNVAKDTISVLNQINQTTDIYRTQQVCYNYFLVQSLAVIFLAVAHAPAEFARETRDEFYAALDLVKGFSSKSYISKKLWQTIRGLREVGEKIGLLDRARQPAPAHDGQVADAHSTAAVAMAGLAGHSMEEFDMFNGGMRSHASELGTSPLDGQQLTNELTSLFELAGGYTNFMDSSTNGEVLNGFVGTNTEGQAVGVGMSNLFANEQELSRIMAELF